MTCRIVKYKCQQFPEVQIQFKKFKMKLPRDFFVSNLRHVRSWSAYLNRSKAGDIPISAAPMSATQMFT
jgi:hypothetical protein